MPTNTITKADNHGEDIQLLLQGMAHLPKRGIVHIGAHKGEEVEEYFRQGFERVLLIEAQPHLYQELCTTFAANPRITVLGYAIADAEKTVEFYVHTSRSGNTEPAGLLPMKRFTEIVKTMHTPEVLHVQAMPLDTVFVKHNLKMSDYNVLNIDIQGAEILAFKGADVFLSQADAIISEVNIIELYDQAPLERDIVEYLARYGFYKHEAIYHTLYDEHSTFPAWGECLFLKESTYSPLHSSSHKA